MCVEEVCGVAHTCPLCSAEGGTAASGQTDVQDWLSRVTEEGAVVSCTGSQLRAPGGERERKRGWNVLSDSYKHTHTHIHTHTLPLHRMPSTLSS